MYSTNYFKVNAVKLTMMVTLVIVYQKCCVPSVFKMAQKSHDIRRLTTERCVEWLLPCPYTIDIEDFPVKWSRLFKLSASGKYNFLLGLYSISIYLYP